MANRKLFVYTRCSVNLTLPTSVWTEAETDYTKTITVTATNDKSLVEYEL